MNVKAEHISQVAIALYKFCFFSWVIFLAIQPVRLIVDHQPILNVVTSIVWLIATIPGYIFLNQIDWGIQTATLSSEPIRNWESDPAGVGNLAAKMMVLFSPIPVLGLLSWIIWIDWDTLLHPVYNPTTKETDLQIGALLLAVVALSNATVMISKGQSKWLIQIRSFDWLPLLIAQVVFVMVFGSRFSR
jgi:hypothetical protein